MYYDIIFFASHIFSETKKNIIVQENSLEHMFPCRNNMGSVPLVRGKK